jgi:nicotinamide riboside transporter PnuC
MYEWTWIITVLSAFAIVLNARKLKVNWLVFIIADALWIIFDLSINLPAQATVHFFAEFVNFYGLYRWYFKKQESSQNIEEEMLNSLPDINSALYFFEGSDKEIELNDTDGSIFDQIKLKKVSIEG